MADQAQPPATTLVIPPDAQAKYGPLIEMIKASESMNNEERQYWINILAVMTPEQIKNLEDILMNEKQQLAAIDAKYKKDQPAGPQVSVEVIGEKIKSKKEERQKIEEQDAAKEQNAEADLIAQIQAL